MISHFYSIYDRVAAAYMMPFASHNDGLAIRAVGGALADSKTPLAANSPDLQLFYVYSFDDSDGSVKVVKDGVFSSGKPRFIISLSDILNASGRPVVDKVVSNG